MKKNLLLLFFVVLLLTSCNQNIGNSNNAHDILEHEFDQVEIVKEATCTEEGIRKLVCSCGASVEEKITVKQHSFEWETQKAETCTENGLAKGTCSYCGYVEIQVVEALGHSYTWNTTQEATCTEEGVVEGICSCGDVVIKTLEAKGHVFDDETVIEVSATTEMEGSLNNACLNCGEETIIKLMKTPKVTRNMATLSWESISGADGYNVYIDNKLYTDVGNELSFDVPLDVDKTYLISVEAYSNSPDYYLLSEKSDVVVVNVKCNNSNLQANLGTDFEGFKDDLSPVTILSDALQKYYGNFSSGSVEVFTSVDNCYAKLLPLTNNGKATITHSASTDILNAGTYIISMDVKLGSSANGALSFGLYDGKSWYETANTNIDISNANSSEWTKVSSEFTLTANATGEYANIDISYLVSTSGENNYIMIDNIKFVNKETGKAVYTGRNINFESFYNDGLLDTLDWHNDGINDVILVSKGSIYNSLIVEDDGNIAFKAYTTNTIATIVSFKASTEVANAGVYKMSMRVKLGPDATNAGPIGFRMFASEWIGVFDNYFTDLSALNKDEWVTIETYFVVPKTVAVTYNTMEMFFYTNNFPNPSVDNYFLIDNIEIYKVNVN